jgi:hypothetical protein
MSGPPKQFCGFWMNSKPIERADEPPGQRFSGLRKFLEEHGTRIGTPEARTFETEGEAIESGLRRTVEGQAVVMRSLTKRFTGSEMQP